MYTIKEAAEKTDVSEHTLRFWAKSGLFPFLKRNKNNFRMFSEHDLEWIKIVRRPYEVPLRGSARSLPKIYAIFGKDGAHTGRRWRTSPAGVK